MYELNSQKLTWESRHKLFERTGFVSIFSPKRDLDLGTAIHVKNIISIFIAIKTVSLKSKLLFPSGNCTQMNIVVSMIFYEFL